MDVMIFKRAYRREMLTDEVHLFFSTALLNSVNKNKTKKKRGNDKERKKKDELKLLFIKKRKS